MNKIVVDEHGIIKSNDASLDLGTKDNLFFEALVDSVIKNETVIEVDETSTHINCVLFRGLRDELKSGSSFRQALETLEVEAKNLKESIEIEINTEEERSKKEDKDDLPF